MTTIKLKNGSGAPAGGDLVQGEPALDLTNKRLYTENASGTVIEVGTNPTSITTGDITATGTASFANLATTGNITFGDNDKAVFGAGSDLQIYHDASDSYIKDEGTGNLYLTTNGSTMNLQAGSDNMVKIYKDAQVEVFYDASVKLATTSTGIDVTGTVTADGLTISSATANVADLRRANNTGAGQVLLGNSDGHVRLSGINGSFDVFNSGNTAQRFGIANNGDISFYEDTGTTAKLFWDSSAESLGIGTSSPSGLLNVHSASGDANVFITTGTTNASTTLLFGDSGSSTIGRVQYDHSDNSMRFQTNASEAMRIDSSGNLLVGKTSSDLTTDGFEVRPTGFVGVRTNGDPLYLNRKSTDGAIATFAKDGTTVGSISSTDNSGIIIGSNDVGLRFRQQSAGAAIFPREPDGSALDATLDLGLSNSRFKDLYLSGNINVGDATYGANLGQVRIINDASSAPASLSLMGYGNVTNNAEVGKLEFALQQSGTGGQVHAKISALASGTGEDEGQLAFYTSDNTLTERMRIDEDGNLLVGKTSTTLNTAGTYIAPSGVIVATRDSNEVLALNLTNSDGNIASFYKDGTAVGSIGVNSSRPYLVNSVDGGIHVGTDGYGRALLLPADQNGAPEDNLHYLGSSSYRWRDLYMAGGVYLGGVASANHLDDYEEGTWTPVLVGSTTAGTATFVTGPIGTYTKIGNQVTVYFDWNISAHTGTGALRITGLPFALGSGVGVGAIMDGNYTYSAGRTKLVPYVVSSSILRIYQTGDGLGYTENVLDTAHQINGSVTYQTA